MIPATPLMQASSLRLQVDCIYCDCKYFMRELEEITLTVPTVFGLVPTLRRIDAAMRRPAPEKRSEKLLEPAELCCEVSL